jgi:hypothetical protein
LRLASAEQPVRGRAARGSGLRAGEGVRGGSPGGLGKESGGVGTRRAGGRAGSGVGWRQGRVGAKRVELGRRPTGCRAGWPAPTTNSPLASSEMFFHRAPVTATLLRCTARSMAAREAPSNGYALRGAGSRGTG